MKRTSGRNHRLGDPGIDLDGLCRSKRMMTSNPFTRVGGISV